MKPKEKERAISLREQGKTIKIIAEELKVSKGTVSVWVRHVKLTSKQAELIFEKNPLAKLGALRRKENAKIIRQKWQDEGKLQAKKQEWLHASGCMLYWGEGYKTKNTTGIANSDPNLLKLFIKFLKKYFGTTTQDIRITVNCYADSAEEIADKEAFWIDSLSLSKECLGKTQVNVAPKSSKGYYKNRVSNGTCKLIVKRSTKIVQHIFGAMQEYGQYEDQSLIDKK